MNALSFLIALGAIALPAAWLVSLGSLLALPLVRRLGSVARAEAAAWVALAPALVAVAAIAAVSVPSVLYGLGLGPDHCFGHEHHPHVCLWHGAELPAWLAWIGAAAWAVSAVRLVHAAAGLVRAERLGTALAALAVVRDGVHVVPASVALCHAVGVVRHRIIISQAVVERLAPGELSAVVAHERAHVERDDLRWSAILTLGASVAPFAGPWVALWRAATEEAADDVAASATDGANVASALVEVARMGLQPAPGFAFAGSDLERRVRRLLDGVEPPRASRALAGAVALAVGASAWVAWDHERLHHVAEETWEVAVRR